MASVHSTQFSRVPLPCDSLSSDDLRESLEALTTTSLSLLETLRGYRKSGRPGHSLTALWRAYLASFLINVPHTNALIRRLQDDADFRALCGFGDVLPHRTTFNRFIQRLSHHATEVEGILAGLTCRLREFLPDLGDTVAVDSTTVRSHSNPNRRVISDPEASWTAKNSPRAKSRGKEWHFGYKSHTVADAKYGLPLGQIVTTASRNDSPELTAVMEHTKALLPWFKPKVAIADRGYDALSNHEYVVSQGAVPIIHIRKLAKGEIYTKEGTPTCVGNVPMEYLGSDRERGRLYRCPSEGCHLKGSLYGGSVHCRDWVWEDPTRDLRLFGVIRRDGPEWKELYTQRQAIERVFKSMKESRRLERHCVRGLRQITLHAFMSALAFQVTALVRILAGESEWMRWQVRKVA